MINAINANNPSTQLTILLIPQISTGVSAPQDDHFDTWIPISVCTGSHASLVPLPLLALELEF